MKVDKLDENRVLIVLCTKDMDDYRLDYSTLSLNDIHSRRILMRIMQIACFKSGIETKGKTVTLETIGFDEGCYILITVDEKKRAHTYKIKKPLQSQCYMLSNSSDFLQTIELLYRQNICCNKNSAYLYNNKYYIIFEYPSIPSTIKKILLEYGKRSTDKLMCARIMENGKELCRYNAIAEIGKYLT